MAIPNGNGGYQVGAGNAAEAKLFPQATPTAITADATLTVAQVLVGLLLCSKGSDATLALTTPTGALIDAAIVDARIGHAFDVSVCNTNDSGTSSTVTFTGGTGVTITGGVIARKSGGTVRFLKTADATWTAYVC